jgi:putative pyruvate formate lyase activating enzyme
MEPAYLALYRSGELARRAERAHALLERCTLCPLACQARRLDGKWGICRTGEHARLAGYGPHLGEEPCLSGVRGSGAVFFGRCNLRCVFCQNWQISQTDASREVGPEELAGFFLKLQEAGCHNLNLVSPSHVVPQILAALQIAAGQGLRLPLVYNTGGYDAPEVLALLDGAVDIYLPDMKFADAGLAQRYTGVRR